MHDRCCSDCGSTRLNRSTCCGCCCLLTEGSQQLFRLAPYTLTSKTAKTTGTHSLWLLQREGRPFADHCFVCRWYWWTLFFAFLPCAFYTVTQFFTHYSEPGRPVQGRELKAGEKPPRLGRREISWYGYIFLTILNVFQLRMLYEFLLSLWWGFPTGALLDWKLVEVIFRDVPQVFLQSYIMFRQWDSTTPFSFTPVLVCTGFALANIIFAPHSSPCFEDNR